MGTQVLTLTVIFPSEHLSSVSVEPLALLRRVYIFVAFQKVRVFRLGFLFYIREARNVFLSFQMLRLEYMCDIFSAIYFKFRCIMRSFSLTYVSAERNAVASGTTLCLLFEDVKTQLSVHLGGVGVSVAGSLHGRARESP